jgi:GTP-binding protein
MFDKCEYVISATSKKQYPNKNNLPEYVFMGRSNVGKSSLINAITKRTLLAYTSSKPGKTQTINFYLIDDRFYLVDVPGYGYASTGVSSRLDFGSYIEEYLQENHNLKYVFLLIDTKVGPTKDDLLMYEYLQYLNINVVIVATKADKVGSTLLYRHLKMIKEKLKTDKVIPTSSVTKKGIDEITALID